MTAKKVASTCSVDGQLAQAAMAREAGSAGPPAGWLIRRDKVNAAPLLHRGMPIGRWRVVAWRPERFLAAYARQFVDELVAHCRRDYPNRAVTRHAPPMRPPAALLQKLWTMRTGPPPPPTAMGMTWSRSKRCDTSMTSPHKGQGLP